MQTLYQRIRDICSGIEKSFNVQVKVDFNEHRQVPATCNTNAECVEHVRRAASKIVPEDMISQPISTMGGEDFSFFLLERPGCFFFVGSYPGKIENDKGPVAEYLDRPHHKFNFDLHEDALAVGASVWVQLIEDLITKSGSQPPSPKRLKK
jgi:amidohydrolase